VFLRTQIMAMSAVLDDKGHISNLKLPVTTTSYDTIRAKKSKDERGSGLVRVWTSKNEKEGKSDPLNLLMAKRSMHIIPQYLGLTLVHETWKEAPCDEAGDENRVYTHAFLPQEINSQAATRLRA
jgi:hypothetical protein